MLIAAGGGLAPGMFAHGYLAVLRLLPATGELTRKSQEQMRMVSSGSTSCWRKSTPISITLSPGPASQR
jgi:hypothetical protein